MKLFKSFTLLCLLLLTACGSVYWSSANAMKIQKGMTPQEVIAAIGKRLTNAGLEPTSKNGNILRATILLLLSTSPTEECRAWILSKSHNSSTLSRVQVSSLQNRKMMLSSKDYIIM